MTDLSWIDNCDATSCVKELIRDVHRLDLLPCPVSEASYLAILTDVYYEPHVYIARMDGGNFKRNDIFYEGTNKKIIQGFSHDPSLIEYQNFGGYLSWLTYYLDKKCEHLYHIKHNLIRSDDQYLAERFLTERLLQNLLIIRKNTWGFKILSPEYSVYKTPDGLFYMSNNYDLHPMFKYTDTITSPRRLSKYLCNEKLKCLGYSKYAVTVKQRRLYWAIFSVCTKGSFRVCGNLCFIEEVKRVSNTLTGVPYKKTIEPIENVIECRPGHLRRECEKETPLYRSVGGVESTRLMDGVKIGNETHKLIMGFLKNSGMSLMLKGYPRALSVILCRINKIRQRVYELVDKKEYQELISNFSDKRKGMDKISTILVNSTKQRWVLLKKTTKYNEISDKFYPQYYFKKGKCEEVVEKFNDLLDYPGFESLRIATLPYKEIYQRFATQRHDLIQKVSRVKEISKKLSNGFYRKKRYVRKGEKIKKVAKYTSQEMEKMVEEYKKLDHYNPIHIMERCFNYIIEDKSTIMIAKPPEYSYKVVKLACIAFHLITKGGDINKEITDLYERDRIFVTKKKTIGMRSRKKNKKKHKKKVKKHHHDPCLFC
jgi:hypothetical protein